MSGWLASLRRDIWPYLLAPPLLVAVIWSTAHDAIPVTIPHLLLDTTVFVVCVGLPVHLIHTHLGDRLGINNPFRWRSLPAHFAVLAVSVLAGTEVAFAILGPWHDPASAERFVTRPAIWAMAFLGDALVTGLFMSFDRYRTRVEELAVRELRARHESLTAQVQALQARIQPHFLFNCLNTVAGLIQEDPARAEAAVERLADLYRYTLDASRKERVPLAEELAAVDGFLELETLRYGDRLKTARHVDPAAAGVLVPPLVLQPIVENAVVHGIAPRREGGRLELWAERTQHSLVLRVDDDGPGPGGSAQRGSGTALADLKQRLALVYRGRASLRVERAPIGGCRVEIELPLERPVR